jgi:hypothetical protein
MKNCCVLNVIYELPDDKPSGVETFSNAVCHLLNSAVFDVFVLLFYANTATQLNDSE